MTTHRATRRPLPLGIAVALAGLVVVTLTACGDAGTSGEGDGPGSEVTPTDTGATPTGTAPSGDPVAADLTIVVDDGAGTTVTHTLTCEPAGGDVADPAAACAQVAAAWPEVFEPVPDDLACAMIYGGPQTAVVTGTVDGVAVDAEFNRGDGCEIDRWSRLSELLGDAGD